MSEHQERGGQEVIGVARVEGPIVVVEGCLARSISPDTQTTGVFLPYAPVHHLLMEPFEVSSSTTGFRHSAEEPSFDGQFRR